MFPQNSRNVRRSATAWNQLYITTYGWFQTYLYLLITSALQLINKLLPIRPAGLTFRQHSVGNLGHTSFMIYVIAIGAFQAFTAMILLWQNRRRSKADSLLILLLLCIAAHLAIKFYIYTFVQDDHVRAQMNTFIGCCYGPLLYLYALKKKDDTFIPASRWYVFLPFILGAVGYLTVVCVLSFSTPAGYVALDLYNRSSTWLFIANGIVFTYLAMGVARKYLAGRQEKQLINNIGYCMLLLSAVSIAFISIGLPENKETNLLCRSIVYSILLLICVIIIRYKYVGVIVPSVVAPQADHEPQETPLPRKTQLTTAEQQKIWEHLETHLRQTKIFTDADLNLDKLAQALGISKHHLSETLNSYAHKSFYQYINELRIQRAIEQMRFLSGKELPVNMLTLAYDCGFKAKSSFNQYFKKITGVTPTEYYKSMAILTAPLPPANVTD